MGVEKGCSTWKGTYYIEVECVYISHAWVLEFLNGE
jgi:hypothetical protein